MSPYAARALVSLRLPGTTSAAVRILSDALDHASAEVIPTGSVSLSELLRRFRRHLAQQDRELVLLFEDIAIARGLQQDLIDALTTPGRREGDEPLCTLRVALAVTSSYWEEQAPETLSTRAHAWGAEMFDMDVPADEAVDRAPDLVGRYLNAARIGKAVLLARRPEDLAEHVENACIGCPYRGRCHPAFGTTSDGFGLFPLTRSAVRRLSGLADRRSRPRLVLSEVVAPTLAQWGVVNEHRFPAHRPWHDAVDTAVETGELAEISAGQQEALERAALDDHARARARMVLRAWTAGEPEAGTVLEALGLTVDAPAREPESPTDGETEPEPAPKKREKRKQAERDEDTRRIEDWGGGAVALGPQLARRLRGAIWTEITEGVRWPEFGLNMNGVLEAMGFRGARQQRQNQVVRIGNTAAGGVMGATDAVEPLIALEPSVGSAQVLAAFHRLDRGTAELEDLARVRAVVDSAERTVQERVSGLAAQVTDLLKLATLAFSPIAAAGGVTERPTWSSALRVIDEMPQPSTPRTPSWTRLQNQALREHEQATKEVAAIAARSQGGAGAATALDIALIDERALARDPAGLDRAPRDGAVGLRHAELAEQAKGALEDEARSIRETLDFIAQQTGDENRLALKTIDDSVTTAVGAAERAHLLTPPDAAEELRALRLPPATEAAGAVEAAWVAIRATERGMSVESLARLGAVDVDLLATVRRYLELADTVVTASIDEASEAIRQRAGSESTGLGEQVRGAAAALLDLCRVPE